MADISVASVNHGSKGKIHRSLRGSPPRGGGGRRGIIVSLFRCCQFRIRDISLARGQRKERVRLSLGVDRPAGTSRQMGEGTFSRASPRGTTDSIRRFRVPPGVGIHRGAARDTGGAATYEYHYRMFYGIAA